MRVMCWYQGAKAPRNIEAIQATNNTKMVADIQHTYDSKERERKGKATTSYKKALIQCSRRFEWKSEWTVSWKAFF